VTKRIRISLDEGTCERLHYGELISCEANDADGHTVLVEFQRSHEPTPVGTIVEPIAVIPMADVLTVAPDYVRVTKEFVPPVWVERRARELIIFDREPPRDYPVELWKWDPSYPTASGDVCANHASLPKTGWHSVR